MGVRIDGADAQAGPRIRAFPSTLANNTHHGKVSAPSLNHTPLDPTSQHKPPRHKLADGKTRRFTQLPRPHLVYHVHTHVHAHIHDCVRILHISHIGL